MHNKRIFITLGIMYYYLLYIIYYIHTDYGLRHLHGAEIFLLMCLDQHFFWDVADTYNISFIKCKYQFGGSLRNSKITIDIRKHVSTIPHFIPLIKNK